MEPHEWDAQMYGEPPGIPENVMDEGVALPDMELAEALDLAARHARRATVLRLTGHEIAAMFQAEHERLTERALEVLEPIKAEVERRERMVELIHRRFVKKIGKTLKLPTGPDSKLTKAQPELVVEDEAALRAWAEESTLLTVLWPPKAPPAPTLSRAALKAAAKLVVKLEPGAEAPGVTTDGEFVPGVKYVARHDHWNYGKAEK